ncbi:MAG: hypothetical protein ACYDHD_09690 [Vulcanimicrobiaceae bacterium]
MNRLLATLGVAAAALTLAACQGGGFGGGGSYPSGVTPPMSNQPGNAATPGTLGASPVPGKGKLVGAASPPPGDSATYPFADAPKGLHCPQVKGFSCLLRFNVPKPSPTPTGSGTTPNVTASASPSPTPSATPSPVPSASGSPAAGPTPSSSPSGPMLSIKLAALPGGVPKMVNPSPHAVATTPLLSISLVSSADVILNGRAVADFILPKAQLGGRSFALQLFYESIVKKPLHKPVTVDRFMGSYAKSSMHGTTLRFTLDTPKLEVKKGETWLLVLYGNDRPTGTASPSAAPSAAGASPSASAEPSPVASPT